MSPKPQPETMARRESSNKSNRRAQKPYAREERMRTRSVGLDEVSLPTAVSEQALADPKDSRRRMGLNSLSPAKIKRKRALKRSAVQTHEDSGPPQAGPSVSAPSVLANPQGLRMTDNIVGTGAFNAVAGDMIIGYDPELDAKRVASVVPRAAFPSVLGNSEDVDFSENDIREGAFAAVGGDVKIRV